MTVAIVASVWRKICREGLLPDSGTPIHLLWSFAFLKVYETEPQMALLFHTTRKTFREWVWRFVDAIFYLDVVSLHFCDFPLKRPSHPFVFKVRMENRFMNDNGSRCKLTIDGMDVFIREQRPFCPKWWSHKSNDRG